MPQAREVTALPNGDLLVGTSGRDVYIVRGADGKPAQPRVFAHFDDEPAAGVAAGGGFVYVATQFALWRAPYRPGDAAPRSPFIKIAGVRPSGVARDHVTTTLALARGKLYASVGSSCDVCDPELDATRATIQELNPDGSGMHPRAVRIRNAIALAPGPGGSLWAGVAGQDELERGHPYEIFDDVTAQHAPADYGWPYCYENRRQAAAKPCSNVAVAKVVFPAYETPIGAVMYPERARGKHAFPARYRGGFFVTLHGSWHRPPVPPRVVFVPMRGPAPLKAVDWRDPAAQWSEFVGGYQDADGTRSGRPTGIAVAPDGSLFVADDFASAIYRIRPLR